MMIAGADGAGPRAGPEQPDRWAASPCPPPARSRRPARVLATLALALAAGAALLLGPGAAEAQQVDCVVSIPIDRGPHAPSCSATPGPGAGEITLRWTPADTGPVATSWFTNVGRDDNFTGSTHPGSAREAVFGGLTPGLAYRVNIWGIDASGIDGDRVSAFGVIPPSQGIEEPLPSVSAASVDGTTVTLVFDEAPESDVVLLAAWFTVSWGGVSQAPTDISVEGRTATLTLAVGATPGDVVSVAYQNGAALSVANVTRDTTAPALKSAVVEADRLTLTFDEALDERAEPVGSAFTVTALPPPPNSAWSIAGTGTAAVDGAKVTVTLASAA